MSDDYDDEAPLEWNISQFVRDSLRRISETSIGPISEEHLSRISVMYGSIPIVTDARIAEGQALIRNHETAQVIDLTYEPRLLPRNINGYVIVTDEHEPPDLLAESSRFDSTSAHRYLMEIFSDGTHCVGKKCLVCSSLTNYWDYVSRRIWLDYSMFSANIGPSHIDWLNNVQVGQHA